MKSNPKLPHLINLCIGDWSGDGHEKSEDIYIESNLTAEQIQEAYKRGVEIVGVDCTADVCSEYEDHKLSNPHWRKYIDAGICEPPFDWVSGPDDGAGLDWIEPEGFADLFLLTVLRGNPEFRFEYPIGNEVEQVNIGGYGLFY